MSREKKVIWITSAICAINIIVWLALSKIFVWGLYQESLMLKFVLMGLISMALTVPVTLMMDLTFEHYKDTWYGQLMMEASKFSGSWLLD